MTEETFKKASSLWGRIVSAKGYITRLHQWQAAARDAIKKEEIEEKIKTRVAALDQLIKEFKEL